MPQFLESASPDFEVAFTRLLGMKREDSPDVDAIVAGIIADVRSRGDAAVIELTAKFDRLHLTSETLRFSETEIDAHCANVPAAEREALEAGDATLVDMRTIDEVGIRKPLADFLAMVEAANGMLHVSLDVDFLDLPVAPAVGTTVPGGATVREGHLVMEMLCDSGLVTSLDLVELNPFLDDRGKTANLMVDLTASLLGRRIFDRPTRSHS